jgi:hypothetical protein
LPRPRATASAASAVTSLESSLRDIERKLAAARIGYALIGGLAVSVRTEPRFTRDADRRSPIADRWSLPAESRSRRLTTRGRGAYKLLSLMGFRRMSRAGRPIASALVLGVMALTAAAISLATAPAGAAQEPIISRSAPMTLTGEVLEMSCYKQKGVAGSTGAAHVACAKVCVLEKNSALGILSDGDGLFRLWGAMARDKYAKLLPYVGQTVVITGTEVVLSNNYDVRSFDVQSIKVSK